MMGGTGGLPGGSPSWERPAGRGAREPAGRSGGTPRRVLHQAGAGGFVVRTACDGAEGLELSRSADLDLIVLDLVLPTVTGEEILARLRAAGSSVPVIVLTSSDAVPDQVAILNAGADDYVTRPCSFSELLARIRARLRAADQTVSTTISHGHHRRRDTGCSDRWELGRPHAPGVRPARDADATWGSGPFTTPAPRSGLGIRPRSELQRGGGLRRLSPQEAPTRRRGDRPRRRVSVPRLTSASGSFRRSRGPTLGDRRDLVGCLPSRSAAPCVYGRKGVVLAETARDPRGDWLLSRPSRAGAASPRPLAGKPAESNQLTDLAGSGWSTGRRLDRG